MPTNVVSFLYINRLSIYSRENRTDLQGELPGPLLDPEGLSSRHDREAEGAPGLNRIARWALRKRKVSIDTWLWCWILSFLIFEGTERYSTSIHA